jgi:hypothetical protein
MCAVLVAIGMEVKTVSMQHCSKGLRMSREDDREHCKPGQKQCSSFIADWIAAVPNSYVDNPPTQLPSADVPYSYCDQ